MDKMDKVAFFDDLAAHWDADEVADIDKRLERVVSLARIAKGESVLDVGTGTGVLIPHLLRAIGPSGNIVAIDISSNMLNKARRKGFPTNVHFLLANIENSAFPNECFDRILCNAVYPHFENKKKALLELRRVLRAGGALILSHPIGRAKVNSIHRKSSSIVAEDRVPSAAKMREILEEAGFERVSVIDEPDFYLAYALKPPSNQI